MKLDPQTTNTIRRWLRKSVGSKSYFWSYSAFEIQAEENLKKTYRVEHNPKTGWYLETCSCQVQTNNANGYTAFSVDPVQKSSNKDGKVNFWWHSSLP